MRRRLGRRFGRAIDPWFDALPTVLGGLAERWELEWDTVIERGSMSVVVRCRTGDGRRAVLKVSPDHERIAAEASALASWSSTPSVPACSVDERRSAPDRGRRARDAADLADDPSIESLAQLLRSLHGHGVPDPRYRPVADRIAHLFDSGRKNYGRRPDLAALVPAELYERGRRSAMRLAAAASAIALLHGDLTPVNVLDGGDRGLVAIDPAPCVGDPAFDTVDLIFWRSGDVETVALRAQELAPAVGAEPARVVDWCIAFAAMVALELAEAPAGSSAQIEHLLALASRA